MLYKIWSIRPKWLPLDVKTFKNRDEILLTISQSRPVWTSGVTFGIEQIQLLGQAGRPWQHAATWCWNWTGIKVAVIIQLFSCRNRIVLYVLNCIERPKTYRLERCSGQYVFGLLPSVSLVSFSNNVRTCTVFLHLSTIIRRTHQLVIKVYLTL